MKKSIMIIISSKKNYIIGLTLILIGFIFVSSNYEWYDNTIAKITSVQNTIKDHKQIKEQQIKAVIMNGKYKDEVIELQNISAISQAYDYELNVNDEVFVIVEESSDSQIVSAEIIEYKRDEYIGIITIIFILLILLIGGKKGNRTLLSVVINTMIFSAFIGLFLQGFNLILISAIVSLLFVLLTIPIVSGINKKTTSAIIATITTTVITLIITIIVLLLTDSNGVNYEEIETFSFPPHLILPIQILIGTLGAIMDNTITVSSSIHEIYDTNTKIKIKQLIESGREVGNDIMGTMTNTIFLAYISGSVPMILLLLKNGIPMSQIINYDISLEIIRALIGSIGIVISIPVALFVSIIFIKYNHQKT
ncbi:MAG: YibE/F family protein [Eubacteriales bacterium]